MLQKSEPALVDAAKGGDEAAFRALVEPLRRELTAYAYRLLGGYQDAEDALQETCLKAWRHLGSYEPTASFRAWAYRIATNTCLDGPYVAVCMTVMTLAPDGRVSNMDTFVLPKQFTAWGHPVTLDPAVVQGHPRDPHPGYADIPCAAR